MAIEQRVMTLRRQQRINRYHDSTYQVMEQRRLMAADAAVFEPDLDPNVSAVATAFISRDPQDANDSYDILTGWKATVDEFVSLGINEITFAVFRQSNNGVLSGGPALATVRSAVDYANDNGLAVTILPLFETEQGWRGDYDPTGEARDNFRSNYASLISDLSSISGIDRFNIGSELNRLVENPDNFDFLVELIDTARTQLDASGNTGTRIGYAANFDIFSSQQHHRLLTRPGLDYFGVSAYNRIIDRTNLNLISGTGEVSDGTFQLLVDQWNQELDRITDFASSIDLPLIIQEFGAVQRNYAAFAPFAVTPGEFVDGSLPDRNASDPLEQKAAYESLITALNGRGDQIESVTFWTWEHQASRGRRTFEQLGTSGVIEHFAIWPTDGGGGEFLTQFLATASEQQVSLPTSETSQTSVFASIVNDQLQVIGTLENDVISVVETEFSVNVTVNGVSATFNQSDFIDIVIEAAAGNDEVRRSGLSNLHVLQNGGEGDDILIGNDGIDTLIGGLGNDQLFANGGDDILQGGEGDDLLIGHGGNDTLEGGAGADRLFGHAGNDELDGGSEDDTIVGGAGNDFLSGGAGNDRLTGSLGNDTIFGDQGDDTIFGSAGLNTLRGGNGNDTIYGGDHADQIFGEAGIDQLFGLDGDDFLDAGDGGVAFSKGVNQADLVLGLRGNDTIVAGNGLNILWGGDGDDRIIGGLDAENRLHGQTGNDVLTGGDQQDFITVGQGNDDVRAGAGNDFIIAGVDNDRIDGGSGLDSLRLTGGQQSYRVYENQDNATLQVRDLRRQFSQGDDATTSVETLDFADTTSDAQPTAVTRRVTVRPIVVSNDDDSQSSNLFVDQQTQDEIKNLINDIYSQANLEVVWQTTKHYNDTFANIDSDADTPRSDSVLNTIIENGDAAGVGSADPNVIDLYFVSQTVVNQELIDNGISGSGLLGQSGAVVQVGENLSNSTVGQQFIASTIARVLGQNLGLATNTTSPANLAYVKLTDNADVRTNDNFITTQQVNQILQSPIAQPIA